MKKVTYTNAMPYIYNPERRGAKYSMDGGKTFKNHESFAKASQSSTEVWSIW